MPALSPTVHPRSQTRCRSTKFSIAIFKPHPSRQARPVVFQPTAHAPMCHILTSATWPHYCHRDHMTLFCENRDNREQNCDALRSHILSLKNRWTKVDQTDGIKPMWSMASPIMGRKNSFHPNSFPNSTQSPLRKNNQKMPERGRHQEKKALTKAAKLWLRFR